MSLRCENIIEDKTHCSLLDVQDDYSFEVLSLNLAARHSILETRTQNASDYDKLTSFDQDYGTSVDPNYDPSDDELKAWMMENITSAGSTKKQNVCPGGNNNDLEGWLTDIFQIEGYPIEEDDELSNWLGEDYKHGYTFLFDKKYQRGSRDRSPLMTAEVQSTITATKSNTEYTGKTSYLYKPFHRNSYKIKTSPVRYQCRRLEEHPSPFLPVKLQFETPVPSFKTTSKISYRSPKTSICVMRKNKSKKIGYKKIVSEPNKRRRSSKRATNEPGSNKENSPDKKRRKMKASKSIANPSSL